MAPIRIICLQGVAGVHVVSAPLTGENQEPHNDIINNLEYEEGPYVFLWT